MGIKGIYKEIGPGKRVSLCKLAVDHLEATGQPLKVAIDFAIWSFQAQAARGGANPAIRTLFYRLVRLLSLTITPIFVFDGPNKPAFKRGKRSRGPGDTVSVAMAKRLFTLFGFAIHDAPGEAEAECALLQQQGVVDAVLSEDVDTIMFGCTRTLRNWSADGARAAKTPTHVSVYDVAELRQGETGLDREGMVLVALMSGGDYIPEGVPGCGVKVACEAAKAGFGRRLCRIKRSDLGALRAWREELMGELRTNESGFFRVKHKALTIPEDFPNIEVLRYYTHPVVSQAETVERLRRESPAKQEIDIVGLREFTAQTFDWTFKIGALKFIKVFAAGLLVQGLMNLSGQELESDDPEAREEFEAKLVKSIKSTRTHHSTDATPELRVSFIPIDIVPVDLDAEEDEVTSTFGRSGLALNSDDEGDVEDDGQPSSGPKKVFDPLQPDLAWVPETVAKLGVPLMVEDWEAKQRSKKDKTAPVKRSQRKASDMPVGALDKYVTSSNPKSTTIAKKPEMPAPQPSASQRLASPPPLSQQVKPPTGKDINPWSIASSQTTPKATRTRPNIETILISSSPAAPSPPPATAPAATTQQPTQPRRHQSPARYPRKHDRTAGETIKPAAKRTQRPRNASPPRKPPPPPARSRGAAAEAADQPSIKSFSRLGKRDVAAAVAAPKPVPSIDFGSDSDSDALEDLRNIGARKPSNPPPPPPPPPTTTLQKSPSNPPQTHSTNTPHIPARMNLATASAPPSPSPFKSASKAMTRLYLAQTNNAGGLGYFKEVAVSRAEAARMVREEEEARRRPGARRMWRVSEVSIVDLTGED